VAVRSLRTSSHPSMLPELKPAFSVHDRIPDSARFRFLVVILVQVAIYFVVQATITFADIAVFQVRRGSAEPPTVVSAIVPGFARLRNTAWEPVLLVFTVVAGGLVLRGGRHATTAYRAAILGALGIAGACAAIVAAALQLWKSGVLPVPLF
jgi:hypothetical protein